LEDVDVVVGIILNGKKFLVERRGLDEKIDPGIVCLPGGHVKINESKEEALKREMHEELGIKLQIMKESRFVNRLERSSGKTTLET